MAARPSSIGSVLTELFLRRGFGRVQSHAARVAAWREAVGESLAAHTQIGGLRRGVLEVQVAHAVLAQELTYQKPAILARLAETWPDEAIRDLKLRTGPLS